jgi:hypothetical protein
VVRTVAAAIALMEIGEVSEASLDDDLGTDEHGRELPKGRTLVSWMAGARLLALQGDHGPQPQRRRRHIHPGDDPVLRAIYSAWIYRQLHKAARETPQQ